MSDFEFEGEIINHSTSEEDPAAAFLAREQNDLAGLEDDNLGLESATVSTNEIANDFTNQIPVSSELQNGPSNSNSNIHREEPLKIRMWREEQQRMLQLKDEEEEKKKHELQQEGRHELDEWYARYSEQIEKAKLNNRNAEREWVCERDAESPGLEWERVARLCDFNPKAARASKDTSRMRSIILQLKQVAPPKSTSA